ncbi:MAG: glutamine synthetase beta-grasp domain-containing protein, partial [candidate division Zixibacteria bacterium]|nr:glutamine synthetase beta-grasp domain-containing protein [candidate division Zixibacteria bacterium]
MNLTELKKLAIGRKIEFIDLKISDLPGLWHHITMPVSSLNKDLFTTGVGVDASSLPGFSSIERGDMIMIPDADTAFVDPFHHRPTLSLICNIMDVHDKILPYTRNPRRVAHDAERYLNKIKPGLKAIMGPEFEFYV